MYTTNVIESIHASFRKVPKKGAFPNENALMKLFYLLVSDLSLSRWSYTQLADRSQLADDK
ncbi:hypothetical protein D347_00788 [Enterococcus faecalis LA3B-2]|nr:hypothetical protein D347_00788 [Enterococcus faecalis LA3B-2]